jgi:hypothetical protein
MAEDNELYTDYALQIFSSYIRNDLTSMDLILQSFKSDGKAIDDMFMPGLIYGLMFHWSNTLSLISSVTGTDVEKLLSDYAIDYAVAREELLDNPLLNVYKAREILNQIIEAMNEISKSLDDIDDEYNF